MSRTTNKLNAYQGCKKKCTASDSEQLPVLLGRFNSAPFQTVRRVTVPANILLNLMFFGVPAHPFLIGTSQL